MDNIDKGRYSLKKSMSETMKRYEDYWENQIIITGSYIDRSYITELYKQDALAFKKDNGCNFYFKSNFFCISGPMHSVEKARQIVREWSPLEITLEAKDYREDVTAISDDPLLRDIAIIYGLNTLVRTNQSSGDPFFVVRGSAHQSKAIREAILRLQQRFMNTKTAICSLTVDVLRPRQSSVVGQNGSNINLISQITGATIHYPHEDQGQTTTFFIRGTIDAILLARLYVIGCLPMSFSCKVPRSEPLSREDVLKLETDLKVTISPGQFQDGTMTLEVKGQERQASQIYAVSRRLICGILPDEAVEYDFMRDFCASGNVPSPSLDGASRTVSTSRFNPVPDEASVRNE